MAPLAANLQQTVMAVAEAATSTSLHGDAVRRTERPPAAVVVDPYSSGRFLLYELQARGVAIICLRSSLKLGAFFLRAYYANKERFAETVDFESMPKLLDDLAALPYTVVGVLPGCEPGVALADELAEALGMPAANGTALLEARKSKAGMQARLREVGVPAAEQVLTSELDVLLNWARARGQWPVVIKPTGSSGSDGVFFCRDEAAVVEAHRTLVGHMNPNGTMNDQVVMQEFLKGDEYIVDTVSSNGRHLVVAVWVYTKRRGTPWNPTCVISEGNRLLPPTGPIQDALVDYVFQVLDAVGLRHGPCHTEVMFTPAGPRLVEVNARLHGLQGPKLIELATGTSMAAYAVDVLAGDCSLFERHYNCSSAGAGRWHYPVHKHCHQVVLISPNKGYLLRAIDEAVRAMNLPSLVDVLPSVRKGQWLSQTSDLNDSPGFVLLVHESEAQIQTDLQCILDAEASGRLYPVSEQPLPESPPGSPRAAANSPPASPRLQSVEKAPELWAEHEQDSSTGLPPCCAVELTGLEE